MTRSLTLTTGPIREAELLAHRVPDARAGAVLTFLGVVREQEAGAPITGLDYSAFEPMARHQFGLLFDELAVRWPLHSVRLVHRLGPVAAGDASLWLEVTAPHRAEAFAAGQWLIDRMKETVPIWKKTLPAGAP
jgi:molybdopterin synthase catalytic subunit